jgi:phosphoribosylaminoimidazolecarboxamide formyltransferase/IMP cyclohydrolase
MRRALVSVSNKTGLLEFANGLRDLHFDIVSTGNTARALSAAGVPVTPVSEVTGFPEMLDGRVKTLHPAVHAGILHRRDRQDDAVAIARQGIEPIDLVAVNLYPFAEAASNPATTFDALIEEIDIGGPSLLRAAAKNFRDVLVVCSPADYGRVLDELRSPDGVGEAFRLELARAAFAHTAAYDSAIANELRNVSVEGGSFTRAVTRTLPQLLAISHAKARDLRYGENPHLAAAWYRESGGAHLEVLQGKELSFTNLLDLDSAARIVVEFDEPAAVVIKHTNPCGAATGATLAEAYVRARDADALAAYGGIVGLNAAIDSDTARAIVSSFIEAVIAPGVDDDASPILAGRKNLRVVTGDIVRLVGVAGEARLNLRSILDGILVQQQDQVAEARTAWGYAERDLAGVEQHFSPAEASGPRVVTRRQPTSEEWQALRFAWRVCAHVKSNAVIFTTKDRTVAIGAGQMSRVDAVKVATMKAAGWSGEAAPVSLRGSVAASDAFFPFRDGLDAVADAGATAVIQPGGSVRDAEVTAAADERGLAMVFTGRRHFRH